MAGPCTEALCLAAAIPGLIPACGPWLHVTLSLSLSLSALFPVKLLLNNSGDDGSQDIIA